MNALQHLANVVTDELRKAYADRDTARAELDRLRRLVREWDAAMRSFYDGAGYATYDALEAAEAALREAVREQERPHD